MKVHWSPLAFAGLFVVVPVAAQQPAAVAPAATPRYDAAGARAAIVALADALERTFVFPETAGRYAAALRARLAAGRYDDIADRAALAAAVTADLQAVAPDGHLAMHASDRSRPAPSAGAASATTPSAVAGGPPPAVPPAMEQAGMIAPGIAYVRFNGFTGDPAVLAALAAFLDAEAGARTLIVDARTHRGGGMDEMNVLFPRLFARPATVMTLDTRASVAREQGGAPFPMLVPVAAPAGLYRAEHRVMPTSPVSPWAGARVYVLTSGRTASSAEHLTLALKASGRATIVGETTAGAGNYGGDVALPGGYSAFIPFGRSYYPGGAGWEGTGVAPDIAVPAERALVAVLTREGVPADDAEALSQSHRPAGSMTRRRPLRS